MNTRKNISIEIKEVWESFRIYHQKNETLKAALVKFKRGVYEEFWALKGVSFDVLRGETIGIIGQNGSGKSTLLKCIARILTPTRGQINVFGKISPLLELGAGFHPELTGRENIFVNGAILGLTRRQIKERYDDIVAFSELEDFIDTQVKAYSSGMYIRLGFAVAVYSDPDILLIDEILAVGDERFRHKCYAKIRNFQNNGKTIILVTHDMNAARDFCDRLVLLQKGSVQEIGKPQDVANTYINAANDAVLVPN